MHNKNKIHKVIELELYRIFLVDTTILSGGYVTDNSQIYSRDEGELSILDEQFQEEIKKLKNDDKLNIVLMHHGIEYLRKSEQKTVEHYFEDSFVDIVFTGHSHKIGLKTYDDVNKDIKQFTCGSPISDSYSEPSFFSCTFDTNTNKLTCVLHSYSRSTNKWGKSNNELRKFDNGKFEFIPSRKKKNKNKKKISNRINYFEKYGIIEAVTVENFIKKRNNLIEEAKGDIILVGQSLENAFDLSKDSESIIEKLILNKNIEKIDIFLTDPYMFDSKNIIGSGDNPIARIDKTVMSIFTEIIDKLGEKQTLSIYFIPLVQLDHMVFANGELLLRNTLLWTNKSEYKATPLICKKVDINSDNNIFQSAMYNVYKAYVDRLKHECIEIDINKCEIDKNDSNASQYHCKWRKYIYEHQYHTGIYNKIKLYKLYRMQLISSIHGTWESSYRNASIDYHWQNESESSFFNNNNNKYIKSYNDLYCSENLLNDSTQKILLPYVKNTEILLNKLVKKYDKLGFAKIFPSLDIGIPNNRLRLAGGFPTGVLIVWKCGTPIIPVDTTVNVCSSSYYELESSIVNERTIKKFFNSDNINKFINIGSKDEGLAFSFNTGNHFLMLAKDKVKNKYYLVMHSSAKQFKDAYSGLYPKKGNWYYKNIKTIKDDNTGRFLRYIKDQVAVDFINIVQRMNEENKYIHDWFADSLCGVNNIIRRTTCHHYGMPTDYSIAIGTFVASENQVVPIFSKEGLPICLFKPSNKMWHIKLGNEKKYIIPHGWGKEISYEFLGLENTEDLSKCKLEVLKNNIIFKDENDNELKRLSFNYSDRFTSEMSEVRNLWDESYEKNNINKYHRYIQGEIKAVLHPVAVFSKDYEGVHYYE